MVSNGWNSNDFDDSFGAVTKLFVTVKLEWILIPGQIFVGTIDNYSLFEWLSRSILKYWLKVEENKEKKTVNRYNTVIGRTLLQNPFVVK